MENQRKAIHAVAQACRLRSIIEDVAEMPAATPAMYLSAQHPKCAVLGGAHRIVERLEKTRPTSAAFEFGIRGKQRQVTAGTCESALAMLLQQRARPRPLGTFLAQDLVLLGGELGAPFRVGLFDLEL